MVVKVVVGVVTVLVVVGRVDLRREGTVVVVVGSERYEL
jgi:hypothetical protein